MIRMTIDCLRCGLGREKVKGKMKGRDGAQPLRYFPAKLISGE